MSPDQGPQIEPEALVTLMRSSLPRTPGSELRNQYDALVLCCHACMVQAGFRLVGFGEDDRIGAQLAKKIELAH